MLHSVTNGAMQGAIMGAVGGLLLWLVVKVFKLERYFGGKKTPPMPPTAPPPSISPQGMNAWSGDSVYPPRPVLGDVPTPPTQTVLIAVMWGLTVLIFLAFVVAHIASVLLIFLEIPAVVIGIILLFKRSNVNRWNGGAKLALELIVLIYAISQFRDTPRSMPPIPAVPMAGRIVPPPQFAPPPVAPPNLPMPPHFNGPPMPTIPRR